jgi:hypothetical protein
MHAISRASTLVLSRISLVVIVACGALLATHSSGETRIASVKLSGIVAGSYFAPPAIGAAPGPTASSYEGVKVCLDSDNDGRCGQEETSAITSKSGTFELAGAVPGPVIAEISTASMNAGHLVIRRLVFRASKEQVDETVAAGGRPIVVTPLSTEVVRMMEADTLDFKTARANLAARLNVSAEQLMSDPNSVKDRQAQAAMLAESVILTSRFLDDEGCLSGVDES